MKAYIKRNLPSAPKPTKEFHSDPNYSPSNINFKNLDFKRSKSEERILVVECQDNPSIGVAVKTNKQYYSRVKDVVLDTVDAWVNPHDLAGTKFYSEDDMKDLMELTLYELVSKKLHERRLGGEVIPNHKRISEDECYEICYSSRDTNRKCSYKRSGVLYLKKFKKENDEY